jgi:hypothetical protein
MDAPEERSDEGPGDMEFLWRSRERKSDRPRWAGRYPGVGGPVSQGDLFSWTQLGYYSPMPSPAQTKYRVRRRLSSKGPRSARALLRSYLRERGVLIKELATEAWGVKERTGFEIFSKPDRPLAADYVEAAIKYLNLSNEEAHELRIRALREAGWGV